MNCQQFTSFIVEVARGQMMDAASRDGAMRHAESCEACGARLAQEQSLTSALRAAALGMKDSSAPARVEAKLLAAFQASLAPQNATAATTDAAPNAPVSLAAARAANAKSSAHRPARRFAFAATAIAASLVLVVLAALYLRFTQTAPLPTGDLAANDQQAVSQPAPPVKELTVAASPSPALAIEPAVKSVQQSEREMPDANRGGAPQRTTLRHARPQRMPTMIKAQHVIDGGNAIIEASEGDVAANGANGATKPNEPESVTDFISLVADAPAATPLESGQLVRVQVPRAALASLGLPLNAERGNEPVKADVLLGGDGLARAIRFVR
jgi:hypothetical protein